MALQLEENWRVEIFRDWDVLGPFPIQAREQNILSPSFPLNLSEPIDFTKPWPSAYADGGQVSWSKAQSTSGGDLEVSFPEIRWNDLRATEGWAALQHHSVLRTTVAIHPPASNIITDSRAPHLRVQLTQGSFFAIVPKEEDRHGEPVVPEWHAGNIYAIERAIPRSVNLPTPPSVSATTAYEIFVSGDFEIRLFGDPRASNSEVPVLNINLTAEVERAADTVVLEPTHDVTSDFVDGFAFGEAFGVGLRSISGWATVTEASVASPDNSIRVELVRETVLAPSQTRIIPLRITQTALYTLPEIPINLTVKSGSTSSVISTVLSVKHRQTWSASDFTPLKATYFYAESTPTSFFAIPPIEKNLDRPVPPILATHGAGVDIVDTSFWADSLRRQQHSWVVLPTGRTSWGLDWHGPSARDVWNSLDALTGILNGNSIWHPWRIESGTRAIVIGHSNGGQGAWYAASRYPDRTIAVVPAAGYIKSQAYVALTQSRSAHYIDPALRAILDSSLTADDNDLFLTNIVHKPILAIHGGGDINVPTWHSREYVSIIRTLNPNANVTYKEDPGEPHWYPTILNNDVVQDFLENALAKSNVEAATPESFTLTVSIPHESGSLQGWRIEALNVPGRLGKIRVDTAAGLSVVQTTNVHRFSIDVAKNHGREIVVDGARFSLQNSSTGILRFALSDNDTSESWNLVDSDVLIQESGRIQTTLTSTGPHVLVVPDDSEGTRALSVALRIAHDLDIYHRLDAEIIQSSVALQRLQDGLSLGPGNVIVIGNHPFSQSILKHPRTPFSLRDSTLTLRRRQFDKPSTAILFLHPHPTNPGGNALFLSGTDDAGLEKAARLFPIRTGVTVPDWIVLDERSDLLGAAGTVGAGVWGREWAWNEPVSWIN
ncbi:hypothetical protein PLICRDRAFT_175154 [Plicaturopsis crispa FD-325 SS-3]|nr:hypothetical protein PLICRDRAFT_175154 [Plicaturopsis crispa FD-325 SS-3]